MRYSLSSLFTTKNSRFPGLQGTAVYAFALGVWLCPFSCQAQGTAANSWKTPPLWGLVLLGSGVPGDFDGDRRVDFAHAEPQGMVNGAYRYRVDVRLSAEPGTTFEVDSGAGGGLHIIARDVDGDHDLDLVITSAFGREPIGVWINDGRGRFTQGESRAYANSVWQEIEDSVETPDRPDNALRAFVAPTGGWTFDPIALAVLPYAEALPLPSSAGCPVLNLLNPGSPLRAPPAF